MGNKIQILSTKTIGTELVLIAGEHDICIDEVSFIKPEEVISEELKKRIAELSRQNITVVFTSANAVNAVKKLLPVKPSWKIFCIGYQTKQSAADTFGEKNIIGIADNGEELGEEIIKQSSLKKIIFFCGNQRRKVLPEKLKNNGIELEEIVVYKTIEKSQIISKHYDGMLFFSPSGVRSFFSVNKMNGPVQIFAIGTTTAKEIKTYSQLPVITPEHPDKEELIQLVIKYFSTIKSF
ncbi:MAG TPA: uroporphyrinogen-III synthase [Hanamia sp.]|nr:uroporphyrinogen-III synthase [Hanamia sp.]